MKRKQRKFSVKNKYTHETKLTDARGHGNNNRK